MFPHLSSQGSRPLLQTLFMMLLTRSLCILLVMLLRLWPPWCGPTCKRPGRRSPTTWYEHGAIFLMEIQSARVDNPSDHSEADVYRISITCWSITVKIEGMAAETTDLAHLMNGPIRQKLRIIPKNIRSSLPQWGCICTDSHAMMSPASFHVRATSDLGYGIWFGCFLVPIRIVEGESSIIN